MPEVNVKKGESVDRALKRLKNKLESEGILDEIRRRRAFETPTERSRRKHRAATKRSRNKVRFNATEFHKAKKGDRSEASLEQAARDAEAAGGAPVAAATETTES